MEDSSNCDKACDGESVEMILNEMTIVEKCDLQPLNVDSLSCSDSDVSSVVSMKEDCGSPMSLWASDPETETDISSITSCHVMPEESLEDVDHEEENQFVGVENNDDGFSWEMDNRSYEELLKKFIEKEEELRVSNFKLQVSEQEVVKLKVEVENSKSQVNDMHEILELKDDELYQQKELSDEEILKLMTQIKKSESQLDYVHKGLNFTKSQLLVMHAKFNQKNVELDNMRRELNLKNRQLDNVCKELEVKARQLDNVCKELEVKAGQLDNVREELNQQKMLSEKEILMLMTQIKESENQLDNVREELSLKKEELQKQTAEMDTHIPEFVNKMTSLTEQLEAVNKKLQISKDEIVNLRQELDSKSSMTRELQCQIKEEKENKSILECKLETMVMTNEDNDFNHREELRKLNLTLHDSQVKFSREKEKLHLDIQSLSKLKKLLISKLEELEIRNKELGKKVMQLEAEKLNQKKLHSAQVNLLQDEISCLKKELDQRMNDVEAANEESNKVTVEINEANVKVDKLEAEICSREDQMSHMKKYIDELNKSLKELVVHYRTKVNDEKKLIMRVEELEKEVSKQNGVILEKAEEKKEATRQLWSSLEYNWSGCSDLFKR